ncbi:histidine phosphatase family protein [Cesiribacter andamanensis]|uniref:Alpha-ribazole phosphatase n=1 Tax=Cesiribacter andamanensis AMV16 TaxID=1279009 RepID=M7N6R6_9BACT|nr:histidine phosphatase family protein [Cesiribacter andamanensis]EMR02926.1 alpha-ribazole phosphatase [Cesiribacter andamanensis AMV16]
MEKLFFKLLMLVMLVPVSFSCQSNAMQEDPILRIEDKYKELNAAAEFVTVKGVPVAQKTRFIREEDQVLEDYENLRQIALIRHGEPDLHKTGKFSYEEAKEYVKHYDSVGIILPDEPFFDVEDKEEIAFFSSTINRAHNTAQYLFGADREMVVSADFREFERQIGNRRIRMRLPLKYWTTTARIKWMLGLDREGLESFSEAKERARKAASLLDDASRTTPKVVLVAHGFLNRYIKRNLEREGWRVVRDGGDNYFATTILVKLEEDKPESLITDSDR